MTPENPERAVAELVSFPPVLAYDGSQMVQIDAGGILDMAMAGTSATLLARKWESALLVNVDNDTPRRILNNEDAFKAVMNIEGFRALGDNVIETVINKSELVKETKRNKGEDLTLTEKKELTAEERGSVVVEPRYLSPPTSASRCRGPPASICSSEGKKNKASAGES